MAVTPKSTTQRAGNRQDTRLTEFVNVVAGFGS
jgi:hypothetical protein